MERERRRRRTFEVLMSGARPETGTKDCSSGAEQRLPDEHGGGTPARPAAAAAVMPRRDPHLDVPLSYGQEQIWLHAQMAPDLPLYHIVRAVRMRGPLHETALRQALDALVARHEALRTTIVARDRRIVQVVAEPRPVEMPVLDLAARPEAERDSELAHALRAEARRPFDLAADLMLRGLLVRMGEREHVLLLTMHHIASDGWSMGILARELTELYAAAATGREPVLRPLPIQYGDYAVWQRSRHLEDDLAYWKARLTGAPRILRLPADRPRPAVGSYHGAEESTVLAGDLTDALRGLGRRERVTLYMILLAAFQALLHRFTGDDDILVASPIAGRTRVEIEPLIGFFVNTLLFRADLSGDPPFQELLGRVREAALDAYDHQELPFARLVEELRPERIPGRTPLFQVMFALQEAGPEPHFVGLTTSPVEVDTGTAKFDLTASLVETPRGLRIGLEYRTDLFASGTIRRMLGGYETLLRAVAADPRQRLSALPLLVPAERRRLLVEWNATERPFPRASSIQALVEGQVRRTPHAVAVVCGDTELTYEELNRRANRLAHDLRARGVGLESSVGICATPSPEVIVGLLGILKAGGAYVPLDPAYPKERLAFMLEDARAVALVTRRDLAGALPAVDVPIVWLDAGPRAGECAENPAHKTAGDHAAYLMYTSGSTGQPKAVAVPHCGVTRLVLGADYATIMPSDVVAQASNLSFDAATFEIWGALVNGARLVMVPRETVLSPDAFAADLERRGITVLFLTTALFNRMAREAPSAFRTLRILLFGGETADPACAAAVLAHGAPGRLVHVYGPTETTTFASWYPVDHVPAGAAHIPIGRPIANTRIYLLDGHLTPVPIGVPGEIHIGGPGVASGYVGRPELTRDRFIPDPFSGEPGARLYKTGDLARYLPDGNIEFLGRLDEQVKIRGHRIEPGEVEAVLRRHPDVRDALVLVREGAPGEKRLVAYVAGSSPPAPAALRGYLRERLPAYMIPAHIVPLAALPLTPNGKVDRQALPAPEGQQRGTAPDFTEPANPLEHQLRQIWEDLLGIRPIGVTDKFFDLGGHSLLAARLVQTIEETLGRRLPLSVLFERATIRGLAQIIREQSAPARAPVTAFHGGGSRPPFFFLHGDFSGGGFYCRDLALALGPDQPFFALHPHGLGGGPVPDTIEAMAADYLAKVRALQPHGPYRLGGHCNGGMIAFEMARRLSAQGERVELLAVVDAPVNHAGPGDRLLRALTEGLGAILELTTWQRLLWFIELRRRALKCGERAGYYWRRLPQLCRLRRDDWAPMLRRKAERIRGAFAGWRSRQPGGTRLLRASSPRPLAGTRPAGSGAAGRGESYHLAVAGYVPGRYRGTVTLFRAESTRERPPDLGWRSVAPAVDVYDIPGDHLSCITRHVHVLGERLRACLAQTQQVSRPIRGWRGRAAAAAGPRDRKDA